MSRSPAACSLLRGVHARRELGEVLCEGFTQILLCRFGFVRGLGREMGQTITTSPFDEIRLGEAAAEILEDETIVERSAIDRLLGVEVLRDDQLSIAGRR